MTELEQREMPFKDILESITNDLYKAIVKKAITKIPKYFWYIPASSTGKYHPRTDLGTGGLVRHTRAVCVLGNCLLEHEIYGAPFDNDTKDEIRIALLLHDACKSGVEDIAEEHTRDDHPLLVRDKCKPWNDSEFVSPELEGVWNNICELIETHMGVWTKDHDGNEILNRPQTEAQAFVHMCDYIASRKYVEIDVFTMDTLGAKQEDWKEKPAKDTQISYLKSLMTKCKRKNIELEPLKIFDDENNIVLKRGEASNKIQELRKLLGME